MTQRLDARQQPSGRGHFELEGAVEVRGRLITHTGHFPQVRPAAVPGPRTEDTHDRSGDPLARLPVDHAAVERNPGSIRDLDPDLALLAGLERLDVDALQVRRGPHPS